MPCYSPKSVSMLKINGKNVITKWWNHIEHNNDYVNKHWRNMQFLPCKKCIGCKIDYAREWAIRAKLETKTIDNNYFVTLTYSDDKIPKNIYGLNNLQNQDLTRFIKSLRKHYERKRHIGIKYLSSNEYGSRTLRPHYHICFFNLPLDDLEKIDENSIGQTYYISKLIDKLWNKGMHRIGYVTYDSAGYVARYTFKKVTKLEYDSLSIEHEKLRMSKGIGLQYFKENYKNIYKYDYIPIEDKNFIPPRYFDRQYEKIEPKKIKDIKNKRVALAKNRLYNSIEVEKVNYIDKCANEQRRLYNNLKILKRKLKE